MNDLLRDFRYSGRLLARNPAFTAAVILSLAIGIGANAAIFSLINGVLLKPMPFKDSERLVTLWEQPFKGRVLFAPLSGANYKDCREQSHHFESLAAYTSRKEATLIRNNAAERVGTRRVSDNFFATFQVTPVLGRWFLENELEANEARVAVISDALWRRQFAARPDVIGSEVVLDREVYTVVGVSPSIFKMVGFQPVDVMLPLKLNSKEMASRNAHLLGVIGRLKPGVTLSEAQAEIDVIAARAVSQYAKADAAPATKVMRPGGLTLLWYQGLFIVLQAATLFVLLIACTNIASLLLARWTGRQQELAIRAAVGAGRWSMLRLSLCESIILVTGGSLLGLWIADLFRRGLLVVAPTDIPRIEQVQIDTQVLFGIMALAAVTAIFISLVPLVFSRGLQINDWLRQGGRGATAGVGRQRVRSLLLTLQVFLTLVLLSSAGLLIRSLWRLQHTELGFEPENLLTFHLSPDKIRYPTTEEVAGFYSMIEERLTATPGLGEICAASHPPFSGGAMANRVGTPGRSGPGERLDAQTVVVTPEYFRTLGIQFVSGHSFTKADTRGSPPVVIINQKLARQLSPSEDPSGKQLELEASQFPDPDNVQPRVAEIIGVVHDTKQFGLTSPPQSVVYVPFAQSPARSMFVAAKARIRPTALVDNIRATISELDPEQPVYDIQWMTERIHASESERRFNATLLVLFAAIALVASAIGIYGTLAFWVAQRTHEIGVRMALGAGKRAVFSLVVGKVARLVFVGVALGLPGSFAVVRLVRAFVYQGQPAADMFYGVSAVDPVTMLAVLGVLVGSSAAAILIPAWRATRVDPARVLQME